MHILKLLFLQITTMLYRKLAVALIVYVFCVVDISAELFTSIHDMKNLYKAESEIVEDLELYLEKEEQKLNQIKTRIQDISARNKDNVIEITGHPINAFNMIKEWWNPITKHPSHLQGAVERLEKEGVSVPGEDDYNGALEAILRLQQVYSLPLTDIIDGNIAGVPAARNLSQYDYWAIGFRAYTIEEYGLATLWLEKVIEVEPEEVPMNQPYYFLAESYSKIGYYTKAAEMATKLFQLEPENAAANELRKENMERHVAMRDVKEAEGHQPKVTPAEWRSANYGDFRYKYEEQCRQNKLVSPIKGICRYKQGTLPYIVYKQEILNESPFISMFYDVISDEESNALKTAARESLNRSRVVQPAGKSDVIKSRVSKQAWVDDATGPQIRKISRKISDMTGLNSEFRKNRSHAESFQVVNYGLGGLYGAHYDYFNVTDFDLHNSVERPLYKSGHRTATFMFYLSSPQAGGGTVFPNAGVAVPAVKGAAAFWFNLWRSGEPDERTLHGGCPVLLGEKWVANKWFREWGQQEVRKCCRDSLAPELDAEGVCT